MSSRKAPLPPPPSPLPRVPRDDAWQVSHLGDTTYQRHDGMLQIIITFRWEFQLLLIPYDDYLADQSIRVPRLLSGLPASTRRVLRRDDDCANRTRSRRTNSERYSPSSIILAAGPEKQVNAERAWLTDQPELPCSSRRMTIRRYRNTSQSYTSIYPSNLSRHTNSRALHSDLVKPQNAMQVNEYSSIPPRMMILADDDSGSRGGTCSADARGQQPGQGGHTLAVNAHAGEG